jgi:hypothetical protein
MWNDIFNPSMEVTPTPKIEDSELKELRKSLDTKREACIKRMGSKWILHPDHHVKNQNMPANTLGFK